MRNDRLNESHDWDEFSKEFPNSDEYLPASGDGDNMGTQASTALCKLVYKWFNDGDVYDNNYGMEGWCNDISGSANWLYKHIPETREILDRIEEVNTDEAYTDLLYDLCEVVDPMIPELLNEPKVGDAYNEDGPYHFTEFIECPECREKFDPNDPLQWVSFMGCCRDCAEEMEQEEEEELDESVQRLDETSWFKQRELAWELRYEDYNGLESAERDQNDYGRAKWIMGVIEKDVQDLPEVKNTDLDADGYIHKEKKYVDRPGYAYFSGHAYLTITVNDEKVELDLNDKYRCIDILYGDHLEKTLKYVASFKHDNNGQMLGKIRAKMRPWWKRHLSEESYAKLYPNAAAEEAAAEAKKAELQKAKEEERERKAAERLAALDPDMDVNPIQMTRRFWKIQKALKAGEQNPEPQEKVDELKAFMNTKGAMDAFGKYYNFARSFMSKL